MSQISNYPISKIIADRIFEIFLITITQLKDKAEADQFISDLLTPTEKIMIAKRLAIAFLLEKKYDYRSIQKLLRVSTGTITTVNLARNLGSNEYKKVISKIIKKENLVNLFDKTLVKLLAMPSALEKGRSTWTYLKNQAENQRKKRQKIF